jgi:hypothetical protein
MLKLKGTEMSIIHQAIATFTASTAKASSLSRRRKPEVLRRGAPDSSSSSDDSSAADAAPSLIGTMQRLVTQQVCYVYFV